MAERKTARKGKRKPAKRTGKGKGSNASEGFTAEERAAMKERVREMKAAENREEAEESVLEKIREMPKSDRDIAEKVHSIVKKNAPDLAPRTWYGMPAYANEDGKVICFFQSADKFKARYGTLGFNDRANLDEGAMWPTSFALKKLGPKERARIVALVKKAVS
jgi:uncharacterized protein YdhG (YjbR/CyaY superfamily)